MGHDLTRREQATAVWSTLSRLRQTNRAVPIVSYEQCASEVIAGTAVLRTVDAARSHAADVTSDVRSSAWSLQPDYPLVLDATQVLHMEETEEQDRRMCQRGVSLKTVVPLSEARRPQVAPYWRRHAALGDQVRLSEAPLFSLLLLDDTVLLPLRTDGPGGALVVRSELLAHLLREAFERIWSLSTPLPPQGQPLSDEHRRVLELMQAGWLDEAIARRTGVSVKTVRRRITALQELAGVQSRFQLGMCALDLLTWGVVPEASPDSRAPASGTREVPAGRPA